MGTSIHLSLEASNVPMFMTYCTDRSFRSLDSPDTRQSLPLHTLQPKNGASGTPDATGYLSAGPNSSAASSLKRVRSREDSYVYDTNPSGDDYDQHKEDNNRTKS